MLFDPFGGDREVWLQVGRFVRWAPIRTVACAILDVIPAMERSEADAGSAHRWSAAIGNHTPPRQIAYRGLNALQ